MFSESGLTHHFRQSSFCGEGYLSSKRSALLEDVSAPTGLHHHSKTVAYIPASAIPTDKAIQQVIFAGGPLQPPGTSSSSGKECTPVDEESTSDTAALRQWEDSGTENFLHNDDDRSSCASTGEAFWVGVAASEQVSQMAMGGLKTHDESTDGDDDTQQLEILDEDEHLHLQRMYRYVFTEIKRELAVEGYQTIWSCHPEYNQNGLWYDWGDFSFSNGSDHVVQVPCKILALHLKVEYVNGVNVQPGGLLIEDLSVHERDELVEVQTKIQSQGRSSRHTVTLMGEVRAVVHCCEYPRSEEDNDLDTCLMTCWTMEYQHSTNPR